MKTLFLSLLFLVCLVCFGCSEQQDQDRHVILISIDGLRPDFYLDEAWPAPHLKRLLAEGAYAQGVHSVAPSLTYPSHTTIVTGAVPLKHGIYHNVPFGNPPSRWYWEESLIKIPTLWDAVRQAGLKSGAVMWPVTVGAPIDYNFPVRRPDVGQEGNQLTVTLPLLSPRSLIADMEKRTGKKLSQQDFSHHHVDQTIGHMANDIIATHKPHLMAIHFLGADHLEHEFGRDAAEVKAGVAQIDSLVGAVIATVEKAGLKDKTTIIITGDHGFANTTTSFSPNVWLARHGLISKGEWKAKFNSAGGSTFLYLKDKQDQATLEQVKKILAGLSPAEKQLFRVLDRRQLDAAGANPEASLALAHRKGVVSNNELAGEVLRTGRKGGSHGYFPDFPEISTGFIVAGAGVSKGVVIPRMGIQDVSPLVARLLKLDFKAPDGVLIPKLLTK